MKTLYILLLLPFSSLSQEFRLAKPNVSLLEEQIIKSDYQKESIYLYLINNYDSTSSKKEVKHYDFPDYSTCSFHQSFINDLYYEIEECKEAGGISVRLTLPKMHDSNLVNWIELIYSTAKMIGVEHGWNENKTKFRPIDQGAGCYYEIKQTEKNTIIEKYCGC